MKKESYIEKELIAFGKKLKRENNGRLLDNLTKEELNSLKNWKNPPEYMEKIRDELVKEGFPKRSISGLVRLIHQLIEQGTSADGSLHKDDKNDRYAGDRSRVALTSHAFNLAGFASKTFLLSLEPKKN
jgi:hypothetical protein